MKYQTKNILTTTRLMNDLFFYHRTLGLIHCVHMEMHLDQPILSSFSSLHRLPASVPVIVGWQAG